MSEANVWTAYVLLNPIFNANYIYRGIYRFVTLTLFIELKYMTVSYRIVCITGT